MGLLLREAPLGDGRSPPHPFLYTLLILPFGTTAGFATVALAFLATKRGLTVQQGASLIAASVLPNVWKFFWSPVGDKTLTRKRWYVLSCITCAAGVFASAVVPLRPNTLAWMSAILFVTSVAATFLGFAVEGIVAHITPPAKRGSVSGWFQAGNLGGTGVGGGLGLFLLHRLPQPWMAGLVLAASMLACCIPLRFVPDVPAERTQGSIVDAVKHVGRDMWSTLRRRDGTLGAILCFIPLGGGSAGGVLTQAEVAKHWGAGDREVALVQGFLTGIVAMVGCLAGGWVCTKVHARTSYALFGVVMALTTVCMALSPATVSVYVGYNLFYAFVMGLCYAAFSAFVLDAIGRGHAATKYNGFASLSNAPIWYSALVLAWAETHWGPNGMLYLEALLGGVGILIFAASAYMLREREAVPAPTPSATRTGAI